MERSEILIRSDMKELMEEMVEFPYSKWDDTLDTLANVLEVMQPKTTYSRDIFDYEYTPLCETTNY